MSSPNKTLPIDKLLSYISERFPDVTVEFAGQTLWNPKTRTIFVNKSADFLEWSLLHELGHMAAEHKRYETDLSLLQMELEAWEQAKRLSTKVGIPIDQDYIEDCLDSYREWLHKRSTCPTCAQTGIESVQGSYNCLNCRGSWQVSASRFCRAYRKKQR